MDLEQKYQEACKLMQERKYDEAVNTFLSISNYKDSSNLILECQKKQYKSKNTNGLKIIVAFVFIILAIIGAIFACFEITYNTAVKASQAGDYKKAIDVFSSIHGYKDSETLVVDAKYDYINQLAKEKKFTDAKTIIKEISNDYSNVDAAKKGYTLIFNNLEVGDSFDFGIAYKYKKDDMEDFDREDYDALEWTVVATEEDRVLLTTKTICWDCEPFHNGNDSATWENSTLRNWLNGDLYDTIFTDVEKSLILETEVENKENPKYHEGGTKNTKDKLFIPSVDDIQKYYSSSKSLIPVYNDDGSHYDNDYMYFLRTTGKNSKYVSYIDLDGKINLFGYDINGYRSSVKDSTIGTKPFMWVKCEKNKKSTENKKNAIKYDYTEINKDSTFESPIDSYYYCDYSHTGYEETHSHSGSSSSSSSWDSSGKYGGDYAKYWRDNYGYKDDYSNYAHSYDYNDGYYYY